MEYVESITLVSFCLILHIYLYLSFETGFLVYWQKWFEYMQIVDLECYTSQLPTNAINNLEDNVR